jgi:SAM-dependent methyltransferase
MAVAGLLRQVLRSGDFAIHGMVQEFDASLTFRAGGRTEMSRLISAFRLVGIDLPRIGNSAPRLSRFYADLRKFRALQAKSDSGMRLGKLYPCTDEYDLESGTASGQYFHQDLLIARRVFEANPRRHVDLASRIDGFVAHLAVFREVEVFDIRPLTTSARNIIFRQCDIMADIAPEFTDYCDSLSCLHALEHFGLGRYGDHLDPDGHLKGFENFHRILQKHGTLYLAVPIGPHRVEFNAHRVFGVPDLIRMVTPRFEIRRFSFVDDAGELHDNVPLTSQDSGCHFGCQFGLGILELVKL